MRNKYLMILLFVINFFVLGQVVLVSAGLGVSQTARAAEIPEITGQLQYLGEIGLPGEAGDTETTTTAVVNFIRMLLGFTALVFLILIIYAGVRWMMSGGNTETIDKAKKIISAAIIGLVIIVFSYAITLFIFNVAMNI